MSERFDPRAFIAAERASAVETIEPGTPAVDDFAKPTESADFRRFQADRNANYRTIEGVEAPIAANLPWSAGLSDLHRLPRPLWLNAERWTRLVYICDRLDRRWGSQAHAAGWSAHDLFGCHPEPAHCAGTWMNGLAMTIFGLSTLVKVVDVNETEITLEPAVEPVANIPAPPAGAPMRLRRHVGSRLGQALIWEAFAFEGGP